MLRKKLILEKVHDKCVSGKPELTVVFVHGIAADSSSFDNALKYLEDNPDISKNSGFDIIKNMKYKDLLRSYFLSNEFENTIMMLKNKNENDEYIHEYIMMSKNYIDYFLSPE